MTLTTNRKHSESIVISRPAGELYAMISDVTRFGEWSPQCKVCVWDDGVTEAKEGAWFVGTNEARIEDVKLPPDQLEQVRAASPDGIWRMETRNKVVAADPGREFAFMTGGTVVRWGYTFESVEGGTRLTESWELYPDGVELFRGLYGDDGLAGALDEREDFARDSIHESLIRIKEIAEQA